MVVLDNPKLEQDIPIEILHPDPIQPRTEPDADLADSIRTQGIFEAITATPITPDSIPDTNCDECGRAFVELAAEGGHLLILNGERRYRGTIAAGKKSILGKVVPPPSEGARLLRQLVTNTGKPLSPIEEGLAFQRLLEAEGWSQAELARQLGRPRSVVGDRIRLIDLDPVWLDLISRGKLQVSHGPQLHLYAGVPSKYQAEAARTIATEIDSGPEMLTVEDLEYSLRDAFEPFVAPLSEVGSQYKGPVVEVSRYDGKRKYAADPEIWKPLAAEKAKHDKQAQKSSTRAATKPKNGVLDQFTDLPQRMAGGSYDLNLKPGEVRVYTVDQGWDKEFLGLPAVFLANVDRTKLSRVYFKYGGGALITTDKTAVELARAAYQAEFKKHVDEQIVELVAAIEHKRSQFLLRGPGARHLLKNVVRFGSPLPMLAAALGIKVEGLPDEDGVAKPGALVIADVDADMLVTAYVATLAGAVTVQTRSDLNLALWRKYSHAPLKFPTSKKAEKREARAAGKQVGDPKRAKKEKQVPIPSVSDDVVEADYEVVDPELAEHMAGANA